MDKPIIFSGPMVRALLEGRKTMTRRLLRPQPDVLNEGHPLYDGYGKYASGQKWRKTPYAVGDRLYVRESFKIEPGGHIPDGGGGQMDYVEPSITYRADTHWDGRRPGFWGKGWTPSIHMPRNFSRITLTVEAVKVERLRDISEEDAIAEGIEWNPNLDPAGPCKWRHYGQPNTGIFPPSSSFGTLWQSLNAKRAPWDSNPWVVAVSFKVHKCNVDSLDKTPAPQSSETGRGD